MTHPVKEAVPHATPWVVGTSSPGVDGTTVYRLYNAATQGQGYFVATLRAADADLIAAAVNATAGFSTDALVAFGTGGLWRHYRQHHATGQA